MTEVFLERVFDPPLTEQDVLAMAAESGDCFLIHRVAWCGSLLSLDGARMICWFRGADAESARLALRQAGADIACLWTGTVHDAPAPAPAFEAANVVVTRAFPEPVTLDSVQAIEEAGARCLEAHDVRFVRTFFSTDRRRMACLYQAPDAESVRRAQRQAGMPVERVWAFRHVNADPAAPPAL